MDQGSHLCVLTVHKSRVDYRKDRRFELQMRTELLAGERHPQSSSECVRRKSKNAGISDDAHERSSSKLRSEILADLSAFRLRKLSLEG